MRIAIVDYGAGNLASVFKAITAVAPDAALVRAMGPDDLAAATAIIVPGVGHFQATAALDTAWRAAINAKVADGAPLLGICLGMQWLFDGSAEAPDLPGLGVFAGRCFALPPQPGIKIPHVGWNQLERTSQPSRLLAAVPARSFAYFTHTFAAPAGEGTVAMTTHGVPFASVVERDRVFGAQWHPEKSGDTGLAVLRAFIDVAREAH
jgi:glutamine amidotransferase